MRGKNCQLKKVYTIKNLRYRALFETKRFGEIWTMMDDADDYNLRRSFLITEKNCIVKIMEHDGKLRLKPMETKVLSAYVGLRFDRHSFLYWPFNEKMKQLQPSGIVQLYHLSDSKLKKHYAKKAGEDSEHVVLTMDHLSIGFLTWVLMLLISFIAFSIQFFYYWNPKVWKLIWLRCALKYYYSSKINH